APTVVNGVNNGNVLSLSAASGITPGCCGLFFFNPNQPDARVHTWNLTVEKQLMNNTAGARPLPRQPYQQPVPAAAAQRRRSGHGLVSDQGHGSAYGLDVQHRAAALRQRVRLRQPDFV